MNNKTYLNKIPYSKDIWSKYQEINAKFAKNNQMQNIKEQAYKATGNRNKIIDLACKYLCIEEGYIGEAYRTDIGDDQYNVTVGIGYNTGSEYNMSTRRQMDLKRTHYNKVKKANPELNFPSFDDLHYGRAKISIEQSLELLKATVSDCLGDILKRLPNLLKTLDGNQVLGYISKNYHGGASICPGRNLMMHMLNMISDIQEEQDCSSNKQDADYECLIGSDYKNQTPVRQFNDFYMMQSFDIKNFVSGKNNLDKLKKGCQVNIDKFKKKQKDFKGKQPLHSKTVKLINLLGCKC